MSVGIVIAVGVAGGIGWALILGVWLLIMWFIVWGAGVAGDSISSWSRRSISRRSGGDGREP
jgi:hypothetical protein